jgi:hypothetical protein
MKKAAGIRQEDPGSGRRTKPLWKIVLAGARILRSHPDRTRDALPLGGRPR